MKTAHVALVLGTLICSNLVQAQDKKNVVNKVLNSRSGSGAGGRVAPHVNRSGSGAGGRTDTEQRHSGSGAGGIFEPSQRHSGSGAGGGVVYDSILAWCDETTVLLKEARIEAREILGFENDQVGALRSYYNGLKASLQISEGSEDVTVSNSITLKFVARGLKLAQNLGVTGLIDGEIQPGMDLRTRSLVSFFDWFVGYTESVGEGLDKTLYVPYMIRRDCRGPHCDNIPKISTLDLEIKMFDASVGLLKQLDANFVKEKTDRESYYTNINTLDYFKALSFILPEVAKDLDDSLFRDAYSCQIKRMERLAQKVNLYVQTRGEGTLDAVRLNKFSLELRQVVSALENKSCL